MKGIQHLAVLFVEWFFDVERLNGLCHPLIMKLITMHDIKNLLGNLQQNELILDVRGEDEFAEGHVPGARCKNFEEVDQIADELKNLKQVYIYCRSGRRAEMAAGILESMGLNNLSVVVQGGMLDWNAQKYPVSMD